MIFYVHDFGFWLIFGPQEGSATRDRSQKGLKENICVHADKKDTMVFNRVMPQPAMHDFSNDCQGIYLLLKSPGFADEYLLPG
jgi:hypothetical protein